MSICGFSNHSRHAARAILERRDFKKGSTRSLSIIGEATKKIPADVKYAWQSISWREMAGMRDKLVHDYMGVNYYIVWDVAKNIIPTLTGQILEIIKSYGEEVRDAGAI